MYFISEHSSFYERNVYGTLIGIHENYLYAANSFEEELQIYRRKVIETREWEYCWSLEVSSRSSCTCSNTVSAGYGIVGNDLYIAAYGLKPNDDAEIGFHLSSINLQTGNIMHYKTDAVTIDDFEYTLCNQCCLASIMNLNPQNPFEISIVPWNPEADTHRSSAVETHVDCLQTKLHIDPENQVCTHLESVGFRVIGILPNVQDGLMNDSNIGVLEFGKIVYFRGNELFLGSRSTNPVETKLDIVEDSDLQKCFSAGFYRTQTGGIQCLAIEDSKNRQQRCNIYKLFIDEEKHLAKFTKIVAFSTFLIPSDPRFSKFVVDERMLISSLNGQTFSHVFGMLTLSEASYLTASNYSSPLFREYQKLDVNKEYKYGDCVAICNEAGNLGLTQIEMKDMIELPKSTEFNIC